MTDLLARLKNLVRLESGWSASCPAHGDERNSLSVAYGNGRWLLYWHAGCDFQTIIDALGIEAAELFDERGGGGAPIIPLANRATVQPDQKLERSSAQLEPESSSTGEQEGPGLTL